MEQQEPGQPAAVQVQLALLALLLLLVTWCSASPVTTLQSPLPREMAAVEPAVDGLEAGDLWTDFPHGGPVLFHHASLAHRVIREGIQQGHPFSAWEQLG